MKKYFIASSILSANFACLGKDIIKVLDAGADIIHFDVMDNHYVPNLTFGPMVLKALRNYGINAPIEVHLMIKPVDRIIPSFISAGANIIIFHHDTSDNAQNTIQLIKNYGCKVGIVFSSDMKLSDLNNFLDKLDLILLMSVTPGFGGQLFIPKTIEKINKLRKYIDKSDYNIFLEVDGGIKINNIYEIAAAGADIFVVGSEIFNQNNYKKIINAMRKKLSKTISN